MACPADRPDEAAALATARICGGEVKIAAQTDEYDEGWAQPTGSVRWEHHYRPVRVSIVAGLASFTPCSAICAGISAGTSLWNASEEA